MRWIQLRVPVGWTNRYRPLPSACLPGGAERTKAAESAFSGWRPRRLVVPYGSAKTNSVLPELGRSSGVRAVKCDDVPPVPVLTATYWRPSTA